MFLSNMFQEMFTGVDGDGPAGGSGALKIWRSFMTDQYAKSFAKAGGIGIAGPGLQHVAQGTGPDRVMSPITTAAEAEHAIDDLTALIEKLSGLVEQETALVHAGRNPHRTGLEPAKAELASKLFASGERFKASAKFLWQSAPARCAALARVQETLPRPCCRKT